MNIYKRQQAASRDSILRKERLLDIIKKPHYEKSGFYQQ